MKYLFLVIPTTFTLLSCSNENHKVHQAQPMAASNELLGKIQVINEEDPICKMLTKDHLSDTAVYKKHIYGFCSSGCKTEFKKAPEKYVAK